MSKTIFTSKSNVLGVVAKYAVAQSPYHRPDNLEVVLDKLNERLKLHFDEQPMGIAKFHEGQLLGILHLELANIPEYVAWNDRKNGNDAPMKFTSRYDKDDNPDDNFIDLDALEGNVVREVESEQA